MVFHELTLKQASFCLVICLIIGLLTCCCQKVLLLFLLYHIMSCAIYSKLFLFYDPMSSSMQVGNIGGREFAESLAPDVQKLLVREFFKLIYIF
jgi:hypothetical protein